VKYVKPFFFTDLICYVNIFFHPVTAAGVSGNKHLQNFT